MEFYFEAVLAIRTIYQRRDLMLTVKERITRFVSKHEETAAYIRKNDLRTDLMPTVKDGITRFVSKHEMTASSRKRRNSTALGSQHHVRIEG